VLAVDIFTLWNDAAVNFTSIPPPLYTHLKFQQLVALYMQPAYIFLADRGYDPLTSGLRITNFKTLLSLSLTSDFTIKNYTRREKCDSVIVGLGESQPWVKGQ
jgi:hypothetical protein